MADNFGIVLTAVLIKAGWTTAEQFFFGPKLLMNLQAAFETEVAVNRLGSIGTLDIADPLFGDLIVCSRIESIGAGYLDHRKTSPVCSRPDLSGCAHHRGVGSSNIRP